jgi:uncharacterized NAD(P)/FAD-binding protein YdhS
VTLSHVAVIGAGASGTIQALHLLREGVGRVTLIEREREPARGTAYGTRRPEHLLNVTAQRMIVYPDDPGHFARWFAERHGGTADDYAPRMLFGDYLVAELAAAGDRIGIVSGEAVNVAPGEIVTLADGRAVAADAVILALGNLRPAALPGIDPATLGDVYAADPWLGGFAEGLGSDDAVLLIGTALTAVDAALTLDALGFKGRILALSRRGLLPRAHLKREPVAGSAPSYPPLGADLVGAVRKRGGEIGWREAVHELRPISQSLWHATPLDGRRRFLRHLRAWWDVHRHRIAPAVAERIERLRAEGRFELAAGRIVSAEPTATGALITWRPRGVQELRTLAVRRIIPCSGPDTDIARAGEPLLDALLAAGRIRPDPARVGVDVDLESRALDAEGAASDTLSAIGPITRGAFWESIAVPDIAVQAAAVAKRIAH